MKTILSITSITALAFSGSLSAQTAYSKPSGYTTQTLSPNSTNLIGINLVTPTIVSGVISGVSITSTTTIVTDSTQILGTPPSVGLLVPGKTYIFEVLSGTSSTPPTLGTAEGTVQEFVTWTGNSLTLPGVYAGMSVGDKYSIRIAPTLQEIFPPNTGIVSSALNASNADIISLPTGNGNYAKYWWKNGSPPSLRTTTTGANDTGTISVDIPIAYVDGILIQKKINSGTLVLSGEVKTTGSNVVIESGVVNLISINAPSGATLFTAGFNGQIANALNASNADVIWVPTTGGQVVKYWLRNGSPLTWQTTTTGANNASTVTQDVVLPPAVYIHRKSGATRVIKLSVPSSYSTL